MKKHVHIRLLSLLFLIVFISSCEKDEVPIVITKAEFIFENTYPIIQNEEIKVYVIENAHRDYHIIKPKNYIWTIEDSLGIVIDDDFNNQAGNIKWIAEETGKYIFSLTLDYGENLKKTIEQEIEVVSDYRLPYTGDYHFMKVRDRYTDNTGHRIDTTYTDGFILIDPEQKAGIIIESGQNSGEYFFAELEFKDGSIHPSYSISRDVHKYNYGEFIDYDSIFFKRGGGGLGGGTYYKYYGKKAE